MPVTIDAELKRRDATLALVNWLLIADADQPTTSLSDPVIDQGVRDRLTTLLARLPATLDAGALRVAIENWVATIAVTGTVALDAATLNALETINANIVGTVPVSGTFWQATQPVSGTVAVSNFPSGAATETTLATRLSETDFDAKAGSLTETAPASDTASSGLNGRLQRIAQRLTSLIALLPGSLGQKAKAASLAVTLASDQDALPITDNGGSLTVDGTFWQATQPVSATNLDVALSTRTKPADQQHAIIDSGSVTVSNPTTNPETGLAKDATLTGGTAKAQLVDSGGQSAEVNTRTDGIVALEVSDDMTSGETFRQALVASTDTTVTFSQPVRLVRVKNESLTAPVFVRDGAISSDTPTNAEMVGVAPAANLPNTEYYPFKTTTIHLRSTGTPTCSISGFF